MQWILFSQFREFECIRGDICTMQSPVFYNLWNNLVSVWEWDVAKWMFWKKKLLHALGHAAHCAWKYRVRRDRENARGNKIYGFEELLEMMEGFHTICSSFYYVMWLIIWGKRMNVLFSLLVCGRVIVIAGEWILRRILSDLVVPYRLTESDRIQDNEPTVDSDGKKLFLKHEWISIWCQQNTRVIHLCDIPLTSYTGSDRSSTLKTRLSVLVSESHRISSVLLKSLWKSSRIFCWSLIESYHRHDSPD